MNKSILITIVAITTLAIIGLAINFIVESKATVVITTIPSGAYVYINGQEINRGGPSNSVFELKLEKKEHRIKIVSPSYRPLETAFKPKTFGKTKLTYQLEKAPALIEPLPYGDPADNYYIIGYYDDDYRNIYQVTLFNADAKAKALTYLAAHGVSETNATIYFTSEYDSTGEAAPR